MKSTVCPSCGAPVRFQSAASILAVCEYCKSTLVRHDLNLEDVGKMAQLQTDGSPLQLRVEGKYRGVHFGVVGRIQLRFEHGLWNEWHLLFDDMQPVDAEVNRLNNQTLVHYYEAEWQKVTP